MSLYFDRRIRVNLPSAQAASGELGVVDITAGRSLDPILKYKFEVEKRRGSKKPDSLKLEIYNLSEATYSHLAAEKQRIVLRAGYASLTETSVSTSELPTLFDGEIFYAKRERSGADIVATVEARAMPSAFSGKTTVDKAGQVSMTTVLNDFISKVLSDPKVKVGVGKIDVGADVVIFNSWYRQGTYWQVLYDIADELDCDAWIENGRLNVVARGKVADTAAVLLSQFTGMIGIPAKTRLDPNASAKRKLKQVDGWTIKSLLNGDIRQGRLVTVDSRIAGRFTVEAYSVQHNGETDGQDWHTTFVGVPV